MDIIVRKSFTINLSNQEMMDLSSALTFGIDYAKEKVSARDFIERLEELKQELLDAIYR